MFLTPHVRVRTTKNRGRGVFATTDIPGGALIADYLAILRPTDDYSYDEGIYAMWYSDLADLCPNPKEEGPHLMNHSCEGNCARTNIGRHNIVFTMRKIFAGEELTYDYFLGEPAEDSEAADACKCGSDFCRGTMYSNPAQYDALEELRDRLIGSAPHEPPVPFGQRLPALETYPESIDDIALHPLFGSKNEEPHACTGVEPTAANVRSLIRSTGKQLLLTDVGMVVEGVLFGGHIVCKPRM